MMTTSPSLTSTIPGGTWRSLRYSKRARIPTRVLRAAVTPYNFDDLPMSRVVRPSSTGMRPCESAYSGFVGARAGMLDEELVP